MSCLIDSTVVISRTRKTSGISIPSRSRPSCEISSLFSGVLWGRENQREAREQIQCPTFRAICLSFASRAGFHVGDFPAAPTSRLVRTASHPWHHHAYRQNMTQNKQMRLSLTYLQASCPQLVFLEGTVPHSKHYKTAPFKKLSSERRRKRDGAYLPAFGFQLLTQGYVSSHSNSAPWRHRDRLGLFTLRRDVGFNRAVVRRVNQEESKGHNRDRDRIVVFLLNQVKDVKYYYKVENNVQ